MIDPNLTTALQMIVGLGLLNVWLLRSSSATPYRGAGADSLRQEFEAYGLPAWFFYTIGFLKVGSALLLIAGLWIPALVLPAALMVVALMVGALTMHLKVKDAAVRSLPACSMLTMSAIIVGMQVA